MFLACGIVGRLRDWFRPRQYLPERIDALQREMRELVEDMGKLRVEQHELVMEWGSTLDKLRTAWARQRKRDQRALHREVELETGDENGATAPDESTGFNSHRPPGWEHNKAYLRQLHASLANPRRTQ